MEIASVEDKINSFLSMKTITDEFFIKLLESKLEISREKFKIILIFAVPAVGRNENFICDVYRVKITIDFVDTKERKIIDLIFKVLIKNDSEEEVFGEFPREVLMYDKVICGFEYIWKEDGNETLSFAPKCYIAQLKPEKIIVLDDLKADGYEMFNRKIGIDFEQSKAVMKTLAQYNAVSAVRYQKEGTISPSFDRNITYRELSNDGSYGDSIRNMCSSFIKTVSQLNVSNACKEKISRWDPEHLIYAVHNGYRPMDCEFTVLNHGDIWLNNMMFKFDHQGQVKDFKLLDFQNPYWGSPSADLLFFIISSVREDEVVSHFDDIIKYYHEVLDESLRKLKYMKRIPTLQELFDDLNQKKDSIFSCLVDGLFFSKCTLFQEINVPDIYNGKVDEESISKIYKDKKFLEALEVLLPFLESRGFLDLEEIIPSPLNT